MLGRYSSPDEYTDVVANGLRMMINPCGVAGTVTSYANTAKLFADGPTAVQANIDFMLSRQIFDALPAWAPPWPASGPVDPSLIRSGDNLQVLKMDGLDQLVMWGTGGRTGHTTIAVWGPGPDKSVPRELWVCESTDKSPLNSQYWPPPYGVIATPWRQWIKQAGEAGFNTVLVPLSATQADLFNETAFWKWFETVRGMPYGYHQFLTIFMDTSAPAR